MRYNGFVCPVCECNFTETDDVVVCPECGTPHHRRCWMQYGKCANSEKHADGFVWQGEKPTLNTNENEVTGKLCPRCGLLNVDDATECVRCGQKLVPDSKNETYTPPFTNENGNAEFNVFPPFFNADGQPGTQTYSYENPYAQSAKAVYGDKKIDGIPVSEVAEYIQKNNGKYIPRFIEAEEENKKISWNWASAVFGGFWLFYRKLMLAGLIFCIATLSLQTIGGILTEQYFRTYRAEEYAEFTEAEKEFYSIAEKYSAGEQLSESEITDSVMRFAGSKVIFAQASVKLAVAVIGFIVMGFLGNTLYKNKVGESIHKLRTVAVDDRTYHFVLRTNGGVSVINLLLPFVLNSLFEMLLSIF